MEITASMIRELREKTGSGMMNCKKALEDCGGNVEEAVALLRKQGLVAAGKKSGRITAEGLIAIKSAGNKAVIIELNAETDFVAKNTKFQELAGGLADAALNFSGTLEDFKKSIYPSSSITISETIAENIAVIGENINLHRFQHLNVSHGLVASYMHNAVSQGMGRIGVLVALESSAPAEMLEALGKQIAMHIAASGPEVLKVEQLDAALVERERAFVREQAMSAGKPDAVIEQMISGRMKKFHEEVVLLEQVFILDGKTKISKMISDESSRINHDIKVTGFVRYNLGEGTEKKQEDFAAEVAAAIK